jgi:hypothetical protein
VLLAAGEYDTIARAEDVAALQSRWKGASLITEPQGHFGYRLMSAAWQWLDEKGWLRMMEETSNIPSQESLCDALAPFSISS